MNWFLKWIEAISEPKLKASYSLFSDAQLLATLTEPIVEDQFWVSFKLQPATSNPSLLDLLYNDDSWTEKIVIKETDTQRRVEFILELRSEETDDEVIFQKVLVTRPERILLRGPYDYKI